MRSPVTRQGWATLVGGVVLIAGGRLLGLVELYVFGGAAATLVGVSWLAVARRRLELRITREVEPPRVHAGAVCRVDLMVENAGRRRTPAIELEDPVSGTGGARVHIEPLRPGTTVRAAYRLPTSRRGLLKVGPLTLVLSDPLGLVTRKVDAVPPTEVTVFPAVEEVAPPPLGLTHDPMARSRTTRHVGRGGEDFYALREYELGDDLRRVHWPTSARRDELMVRQNEMPQHGRLTLILDLRSSVYDTRSLEDAVSAAASIVTAAWRRRDRVRLVTTDRHDTGYAASQPHVDGIMEHLALANAGRDDGVGAVITLLSSTAGGDALVVVTGHPDQGDLARFLGLRSGHHSLTVVQFARVGTGGSGTPAPVGRARHVVVAPGRSFAESWTPAMESPSGPRRPSAPAPPVGVTAR